MLNASIIFYSFIKKKKIYQYLHVYAQVYARVKLRFIVVKWYQLYMYTFSVNIFGKLSEKELWVVAIIIFYEFSISVRWSLLLWKEWTFHGTWCKVNALAWGTYLGFIRWNSVRYWGFKMLNSHLDISVYPHARETPNLTIRVRYRASQKSLLSKKEKKRKHVSFRRTF